MSTSSGYANAPTDMDMPRLFKLNRKRDVSGVSGTSPMVASGCVWGDGTVALHWHTKINSMIMYPGQMLEDGTWMTGLEQMMELHGHAGATVYEWLDGSDEPNLEVMRLKALRLA